MEQCSINREATAYVAVEPVSADVWIEGQYDTANGPEAVLPVNTGWEEQGVQGISRITDEVNNGIVENPASDPHLRTAAVTLTNDFPCAATGV